MGYRADIDGLRAIAVMLIVLFHFGLTRLAGGFVGVDVFFVISGFLITTITLRDMQAGRFGFKRFYMRRLRRLGPALGVTLLATLAVGIWLLSPSHLRAMGDAAIATVFSVSNIFFYNHAGYFDLDALAKPLLHTWSLAVEEQFYLIWPLVLLGLARLAQPGRYAVVAGIGVAGVIVAEWLLSIDPAAAFYLPVARMHEFAVGAAAALWGRTLRNGPAAHLASALGGVMILVSGLAYTETMRFPGLSALLPCLGAGFLIVAGPGAAFNRLLAWRPVVYVGQISYSLYLVHWPLVVFYAYRYGLPDSWTEVLGLTAAALVLGSAMYHLVETPFRAAAPGHGFAVPDRGLLTRAGVTVAVILAACTVIGTTRGLPGRLPPEIATMIDAIDTAKAARKGGIRTGSCYLTEDTGQPADEVLSACLPKVTDGAVVVLGDSHAADIWAALQGLYPDLPLVQLTGAGCQLSQLPNRPRHCRQMYDWAGEWLADNADRLAGVIYSERGAGMLDADPEQHRHVQPDPVRVDRVVAGLSRIDASGVPVMFWGPRPELHPEPIVRLQQLRSVEALRQDAGQWDIAAFRDLDGLIAERAAAAGLAYLSSLSAICAPTCPLFLADGGPVLTDYGHWSPRGGQMLAERVLGGQSPLSLFDPR